MIEATRRKLYAAIAASHLGIETLETRSSESIAAAMEAAYQLGAEERMPRGRATT